MKKVVISVIRKNECVVSSGRSFSNEHISLHKKPNEMGKEPKTIEFAMALTRGCFYVTCLMSLVSDDPTVNGIFNHLDDEICRIERQFNSNDLVFGQGNSFLTFEKLKDVDIALTAAWIPQDEDIRIEKYLKPNEDIDYDLNVDTFVLEKFAKTFKRRIEILHRMTIDYIDLANSHPNQFSWSEEIDLKM